MGKVDKSVYGYRQGFPYTTSWGGSVQYDAASRQYIMLVSEYVGECANWGFNSTVVLATSKSPEGPYKKQFRLFGVMSHEAMLARGPSGQWVVYFTATEGPGGKPRLGNEPVEERAICTREDYQSACTCPGDPNKGSQDPTWMSFTKTPLVFDSWSTPVKLFDPLEHFTDKDAGGEQSSSIDANFNGIIHSDGRFVGLWRTWNCIGDLLEPHKSKLAGADESTCFSVPHAITADSWNIAGSYTDAISKKKNELPWLFGEQYTVGPPERIALGIEDPMIYLDERNPPVYHAIFHEMFVPTDNVAHAYSLDGENWTYTGGVFDIDSETNMPLVRFTDDSTMGLACERPQLIVEKGLPTHIIIGGIPKALAIPGGGDVSDSAEEYGWPGGATMVIPLVRP